MEKLKFTFYSVKKNEDAPPFINENLLMVADGLGGSGSEIHVIDRQKHMHMYDDFFNSAFGDFKNMSQDFKEYIETLMKPIIDETDDTSALWASRIVIGRCAYALTYGEFKGVKLGDENTRNELIHFIKNGLHRVVCDFDLKNGPYTSQLRLPTTIAIIKFKELDDENVDVETIWAGDSRCYALTLDGLKILSKDDEDSSGSITNLFYADNENTKFNYLNYRIKKPCMLFTVSDGTFDPFSPHDHLGLENIIYENIANSSSITNFSYNLKKDYDKINMDDATMSFVALGFENYDSIKEAFKNKIIEIQNVLNQWNKLYQLVQVSNIKEEDVYDYVFVRTQDKFDKIVNTLIYADQTIDDVAFIPEIKTIFENQMFNNKKEFFDNALKNINNYILNNRNITFKDIFAKRKLEFDDKILENLIVEAKKSLKKYERFTKHCFHKKNNFDLFCKTKMEYHQILVEKIRFYREKYDNFWNNQDCNFREEKKICSILNFYHYCDLALLENISSIQKNIYLSIDEKELIGKIVTHIKKYNKMSFDSEKLNSAIQKKYQMFLNCWNNLYQYLLDHIDDIDYLKKIFNSKNNNFLLDMDNKKILKVNENNFEKKILNEIHENREEICKKIVDSLKLNYNKKSIIDSYYNESKLRLFRTYYFYISNPNPEVEEIKNKIELLEKSCESLLIESNNF